MTTTAGVGSTYNSTNPSVTSSNSIDVSNIVSQLMTVANQPLTTLQNKVTQDGVVISDLGTLKSNISSLQTALNTLESPNTYSNPTATSTNSSVATVIASPGAPLGTFSLDVTQTASVSNFAVSGFTSPTQTVNLNSTSSYNSTSGNFTGGVATPAGFNITIGTGSNATTYNSATPYTVNGVTNAAISNNPPSLTDLNNWINSLDSNLGVNVASNIIQTTSGHYALTINGTQTGIANAVSFSGLNGTEVDTSISGSSATLSSPNNPSMPNGYLVAVNGSAQDSVASVNGLSVQRSTNSISDVIPNTTINLIPNSSGSSSQITISQGVDNSSSVIQGFITAYNAVMNQYKSMTQNSTNTPGSTNNGSFSQDPGMLSFIQGIKQSIANGAITATKTTFSLANMGIDLQTDGTLKFNQANFTTGQANGLFATLLAGISVGGNIQNSNNLDTFLASISDPGGTIDGAVNVQKQDILNTNNKIQSLQDQLNRLQTDYTAQYSQLNALLFTLNQTSSQLTSSLAAVTNINSGK
jgi:flagellar hook-associated protein 2